MDSQSDIDKLIQENYRKYPYPNDLQNLDDEREQRHIEMYQLFLKSLNLSIGKITTGLILDVGCGTGDLAIRRFARWGAQVVCLDVTTKPLRIAQSKAQNFALSNMHFVNGSALKLPFPDRSFDVVHSCGVLHHTGNAYVGFTEMVRVCKKGGVLIVSLYNKFGGFNRTLRRAFLRLFAGNDSAKQMALAVKVFSIPQNMKIHVDVYLNDRYGHPLESKHSYGEVLNWFKDQEVEYLGSYPSLDFKKCWNSILYQLKTSKNPKAQRIYKFIPKIELMEAQDKTNRLGAFTTQALMLIGSQELLSVAGIRR